MSHEAIRKTIAFNLDTKVFVTLADLMALIAERDSLEAEIERLTPYLAPPFIRGRVRKPGAVGGRDEGDRSDIGDQGGTTVFDEAAVETDEQFGLLREAAAEGWRHLEGGVRCVSDPHGAVIVEPPPCCPGYPICDCDEASKEPEQPPTAVLRDEIPPRAESRDRVTVLIEVGQHDLRGDDELVTLTVGDSAVLDASEQSAVDSIQSESGAITGPVEVLAKDIERAVCGSRQPPSQEAEAISTVRPIQSFVEDRKDEPSGAKVVPWKASYTPDKCLLAIRMLAEGNATVSVAAGTGLEKITVSDIGKQYRTQIDLAAEMDDGDREQFFASMYRQFLARWKAAGNDPGFQPEVPLPNKGISKKGKAAKS